MKIQTVEINTVKTNPDNPRIIKDDAFDKLVKSVSTFQKMLYLRPIVVNSNMTILGGNMRYEACKAAGLKHIPIIVADELNEEEKKEFIIKDNVSGGEWDWDKLANEWDCELLDSWGLDVELPELAEEELDRIDKETIYVIELDFSNESDQKEAYNKIVKLGYNPTLKSI